MECAKTDEPIVSRHGVPTETKFLPRRLSGEGFIPGHWHEADSCWLMETCIRWGVQIPLERGSIDGKYPRHPVARRTHPVDKRFQEFYRKMAAKTVWHTYGTKLRSLLLCYPSVLLNPFSALTD